ncbi:hypothetical protein ACROYT_G005164 [Oculina patagonica]
MPVKPGVSPKPPTTRYRPSSTAVSGISSEFDGKTKSEMKIYRREQNNNLSTCKSEKGNGAGLGHTLRKPSANITRHALRWTPQGKRNRGRPKTTRRRSTETEVQQTGMSWNHLEKVAKDRGRWRSLVDDLCSTGT